MSNKNSSQLLADSRLAFLNNKNVMALKLAKEAMGLEPQNPKPTNV